MKIVYIANIRIPTEKAHGWQICKMCEEFSGQGAQVELWVPGRENDIKTDAFSFYFLKRNFKIKKIKCFDFYKYYKYLGKFSFYLHNTWFLFKLLWQKVEGEAIIYTRDLEIAWLFNLRRHKVIFEAHSFSEKNRKLFFFLAKKIKKIIVITEKLKRFFLSHDILSENIMISPDGVDLDIFDLDISKEDARKKTNLPRNKIILGYTGSFKTMGEDKGIAIILDSLKILSKKSKDLLFVAIGGSEVDINYYTKRAKDKGIDDLVLFLKRVDIKKLAIFQKSFDILLMPFPYSKHYAFYMSPLKMFEYMASKRPIITSNLPSIKEILNENNCVFFQSDNQKDLAEKIIFLLANKNLADKISEQAYREVKDYTWKKRAEKIINFISY